MKICSLCGIEKNEDDYYKYGVSAFRYCKKCAARKSREWKLANPDRNWLSVVKHYYGISAADYARLLTESRGRCAICGKTGRLHIDHDHKNNRVRGLLCANCNHGVGKFYDDPTLLKKAMEYLV